MHENQDEASLEFIAKDLHDVTIRIISIESILTDLLMVVSMGKEDRQRIMSDIVGIKQKIETIGRQLTVIERKRGGRESPIDPAQ